MSKYQPLKRHSQRVEREKMAHRIDNKNYGLSALCLILLALVLFDPLLIDGHAEAEDVRAKGGEEIIIIGNFSGATGDSLAPWKPLYFSGIKQHTLYTVERDGKKTYLRAEAIASASALVRPLDLELSEYPILSWRWKIDDILAKGDARKKAGDDYAARIYVTFAYEPARASYLEAARQEIAVRLFGLSPPGSAVNYIWANKLPKGSVVANAYTYRDMMIALKSGQALAGQWVREERNVYEDYIKTFGHKPPRLTGIAVMTDSDNTGGRATGYYADIVLRKKPSLK